MRSDLTGRYGRALLRASSLVLVTGVLAACSNDATRLDEFITASTKVDAKKQGQVAVAKQTASAQLAATAAPVAAVSGSLLAPAVASSALPSPSVPSSTSIAAKAASASSVPTASTTAVAVAGAGAASYSPPATSTTNANGQLVLAPRPKNTNPLRMTGNKPANTDSMTTGSVKKTTEPVQKPVGWKSDKGSWITIKAGETLYNVSRRYGVPVSAIMEANGITDARSVQEGQRVRIPTYTYNHAAPVSAPDNDPDTRASRASRGMQGQARGRVAVPKQRVARSAAPKIEAPTLPKAQNSNTYTVQSGDTLYAIARRHGVSVGALRDANTISGDTVRLGQKLTIPAYGSRTAVTANADHQQITGAVPSPKLKPTNTKTVMVPSTKPASTTAPTKQVAKVGKTTANSFRWPAQGRLVGKFGDKIPGGVNDGIDISLPMGTPIKAAESGTVIYSGSELEDFGKLILLSHEGGWVSAYAHASAAMVRRGQKVKRGQVIAKSGKTGNATTPKLHFELRKDSNPVNPLRHLSK
ncbi:MAG: peptidoglycan DD-metalloendopeptidase family protein [Pseudomonadota bacterium]